MKFRELEIHGVYEVSIEPKRDIRGFFARTWCQSEFEECGLNPKLVQCSISYNHSRHTLRGMHFQDAPFGEAKLVRCTNGSVYDVVLDLRRDSPTFKKWISKVLSSENHAMLYIPEGCAHGFLTLDESTEIFYQMSEAYKAEAARGVRWNDPSFNITWPHFPEAISDRDQNYRDFELE